MGLVKIANSEKAKRSRTRTRTIQLVTVCE